MYAKFTDSPTPDSEAVTHGSVELENRNQGQSFLYSNKYCGYISSDTDFQWSNFETYDNLWTEWYMLISIEQYTKIKSVNNEYI